MVARRKDNSFESTEWARPSVSAMRVPVTKFCVSGPFVIASRKPWR